MRHHQKKVHKLFDQAKRLARSGRNKKASKRYEQALAFDPTNIKILLLYANHLFYGKKFIRIVELCKAAIEINPSQKEIYFAYRLLGRAYYRLKDFGKALEGLNHAIKIYLDPNTGCEFSDELYQLRGNIFHFLKRHEEAVADLNKVRNLDQLSQRYRVRSLLALQKYGEALEGSLELIEQIRISPTDCEGERAVLGNQYLCVCECFCGMKKFSEALESMEQLKLIQPQTSLPYIRKGVILNQIGKYSEALLEYNEAEKLVSEKEGLFDLYFNRGVLLYYKFKRFQEAFNDLENALELEMDDININYHYAKACMSTGKMEIGLKHIDIYIQSQPQNAKGYWTQAEILVHMDEIENARAAYVRSWSLTSAPKRQCFQCGLKCKSQKLLKTCANCRGPSYCSRECQKMNWVVHKSDCKQWDDFIMRTENCFPEV